MRVVPSLLTLACFAQLLSRADAGVALGTAPTGHVTVPTFVDGKGPYGFMLDTGADESAVYEWFGQSRHLASGSRRNLSGATGTISMVGKRLSSLAVDGHVIRNVDVDTIPDRADGKKIAGIVGVDVMMNRLAVIDFGCRTFALRPMQRITSQIVGKNASSTYAGSVKDGLQLTFAVTLNGVPGIGILDSGARSTIINSRFAADAGIDTTSDPFKNGPPARGATNTPIVSRVGPIGDVMFAGIERRQVVAKVADLPVFDESGLYNQPVLNIGLDLLAGTRLTVDYWSRKFWLAESVCFQQGRRLAK